MSALTLTYNAGDEQRRVRAAQQGRQWVVVDELDDTMMTGRPRVGPVVDDA